MVSLTQDKQDEVGYFWYREPRRDQHDYIRSEVTRHRSRDRSHPYRSAERSHERYYKGRSPSPRRFILVSDSKGHEQYVENELKRNSRYVMEYNKYYNQYHDSEFPEYVDQIDND